MKVKPINLFIVLLLFIGGLSATSVDADTHTQTLTIVKYGLSQNATGFQENQTINTGQEINHLPIYDNTGQELHVVSDISYEVQEVAANGADTIDPKHEETYHLVGKSQKITTDDTGQASLTLSDGVYLLTELANPQKGLTTPSEPVLIHLPAWDATSSSDMSQLYVYPKSSVVSQTPPVVTPHPKPAPPKPRPKPITKIPSNPITQIVNRYLPKTGDQVSALGTVGLILLSFSLIILRRKNRVVEEENA